MPKIQLNDNLLHTKALHCSRLELFNSFCSAFHLKVLNFSFVYDHQLHWDFVEPANNCCMRSWLEWCTLSEIEYRYIIVNFSRSCWASIWYSTCKKSFKIENKRIIHVVIVINRCYLIRCAYELCVSAPISSMTFLVILWDQVYVDEKCMHEHKTEVESWNRNFKRIYLKIIQFSIFHTRKLQM